MLLVVLLSLATTTGCASWWRSVRENDRQIAVQRGCPRLEWAVLDWNTPARDFYAGLGARTLLRALRLSPAALLRAAG